MELERIQRIAAEARLHATRCREEISLAGTRDEHLRATVTSIDASMLASNLETLLVILTTGEVLE